MTVRRSVMHLVPWRAKDAMRADDRAILGIALVVPLLALAGVGRTAAAPALNLIAYLGIAGLTIAQAGRVARLASDAERRAWACIAVGLAVRLAGGLWWRFAADQGSAARDTVATAIGLSALGLVAVGLLVFPFARFAGRDARRMWLDLGAVVAAGALGVWFVAIGPLLREVAGASQAITRDHYILGHAALMLVAGVVTLRARTPALRAAAAWFLASYAVRLVADLALLLSPATVRPSPLGAVVLAWDASWLLQWVAARTYEARRDEPPLERHESGAIPAAFLGAALLVLVVQLLRGGTDVAVVAVGSAVLTMLLIVRQGVELDERDELVGLVTRERERFRALLLHAYDAVAILGRDGRALFVSPATERLLGADLVQRPAGALLEFVHPEDRPVVARAFGTQGAAVMTAIRLRLRDAGGRYRTFEGHLHDQRHDPRIGGVVLHGIDRTRETRLAEGLEATQPLEALGILAGGLAHDVNNILTVVASHAELLSSDATMPAGSRADVAGIVAASDRARLLTGGLLTLSRKKEGAAGLIALPEFLDGHGGGVVVHTAAAPEALHVWAAPQALAQVVDTVLQVATHEARGRAISIRLDARDLDDAAAAPLLVEPRHYVVVSIGDGVGGATREITEAVRTETGDEWDLAPGDLALLIALAACRELGGTLVRERHADGHRLAVLLPAAYQ